MLFHDGLLGPQQVAILLRPNSRRELTGAKRIFRAGGGERMVCVVGGNSALSVQYVAVGRGVCVCGGD